MAISELRLAGVKKGSPLHLLDAADIRAKATARLSHAGEALVLCASADKSQQAAGGLGKEASKGEGAPQA